VLWLVVIPNVLVGIVGIALGSRPYYVRRPRWHEISLNPSDPVEAAMIEERRRRDAGAVLPTRSPKTGPPGM